MGKDGPKDCRVTRYQLSDGIGRDHGQKRGVGFGTSRRSPAQTLTTFCLFAGRFDLLDNLRSGDSSCATVSRRLKKAEEIRVLRRVLLSNMECLSHSIYALLRASLQIQIQPGIASRQIGRRSPAPQGAARYASDRRGGCVSATESTMAAARMVSANNRHSGISSPSIMSCMVWLRE